jgi:restriction system protein
MNPREFEDAIAYLCARDGCQDARRVGGAGDLGKDVTAIAPDGRRIVIQCKRYGPSNKVGSQEAQRFGGTCFAVHRADVAAVVTTSVFTRPAAQYLQTLGIRLFDEAALAAWASRTGPAPWH